MKARITLLALLGGLLVAVGGTPSATAATVVPCVQTFSQTLNTAMPVATAATTTAPLKPSRTNGLITVPVSATMPAAAAVEDVDIRVDIAHAKPAALQFGISGHASKGLILVARNQHTSANILNVTFDDEAPTKYAATSGTGRFKPSASPLTAFDGTPIAGAAPNTWAFYVYNYDTATAGTLKSWAITVSLSVCDGDGDGAEDHVDNCVGLANPDQVDLDSDGIGDPCDDDVDGDGAPDDKDNCLVVPNTSQSDLDGDGSGDACDDDRDGDGVGIGDNCPTVPNPDQLATDGDSVGDACDVDDDGDDVPDTRDSCPILRGDSTSGCPVVASTLTMKHKGKFLKGRLAADLAGCHPGREVSIFKDRKGKDSRIARAKVRSSGAFKVKLKRRTGKLYSTVPVRVVANVAECSAAKSRKVTVRRR